MGASGLWAIFLEKHLSLRPGARPVMRRLSAADCMKTAYEYLSSLHQAAKAIGMTKARWPGWHETHAKELNLAIGDMVDEANIDSWPRLSEGGVAELIRRLEWCVTALALEDKAGSDWSMSVPVALDPNPAETLVLIMLLAGPGKDYPLEWRTEPRR